MKTNLMLITAACVALVSCKGMKGTLEVQEEMTLLRKKGKEQIKLVPGNYTAKLSASSKTKFKLKVKNQETKKYKSFTFLVPKGTEVPEVQGEFEVTKEQTGQPYGMAVAVATDVSSGNYDTTESCVAYYEQEHVCSWVPAREVCETAPGQTFCRIGADGKEHCRTTSSTSSCHTEPGYESCGYESIPVYGSQSVTYAVTTTSKSVVVDLKDGDVIKAQFDHKDVDNDRTRLSSGPCN